MVDSNDKKYNYKIKWKNVIGFLLLLGIAVVLILIFISYHNCSGCCGNDTHGKSIGKAINPNDRVIEPMRVPTNYHNGFTTLTPNLNYTKYEKTMSFTAVNIPESYLTTKNTEELSFNKGDIVVIGVEIASKPEIDLNTSRLRNGLKLYRSVLDTEVHVEIFVEHYKGEVSIKGKNNGSSTMTLCNIDAPVYPLRFLLSIDTTDGVIRAHTDVNKAEDSGILVNKQLDGTHFYMDMFVSAEYNERNITSTMNILRGKDDIYKNIINEVVGQKGQTVVSLEAIELGTL